MPEATVMPFLNPAYASTLPVPIRSEGFAQLKRGVLDDSSIDVYLNPASDFALFAPPPVVDYSSYKPRHQSLGLTDYKKARRIIETRYSKIASYFNGAKFILEFGAAEGAFLAHIAAVRRCLEHHGFSVDIIPYQRYGMENHLAWLSTGRPGGNAEFGSIFDGCETTYTAALEARELTDSFFAVAQAAP